MRTAFLLLLAGTSATLRAQRLDEVVVVEHRQDIDARDRIAPVLRASALTVRARLGIRDVCRLLSRACGDGVTFIVTAADPAAADSPPLELDLARTTPLQVLALIRDLSDFQAVWRAGCICLVPKSEVKEATWLEMHDVRAATLPLRDFPGPELTLPAAGEQRLPDPEPEPHTTTSGFDASQLAALVREHAARGTWESDDVSVDAQRGILLVRQTERGHREVKQLLRQLGVPVPAVRARPHRADGARPGREATRPAQPAGPLPEGRESARRATGSKGVLKPASREPVRR